MVRHFALRLHDCCCGSVPMGHRPSIQVLCLVPRVAAHPNSMVVGVAVFAAAVVVVAAVVSPSLLLPLLLSWWLSANPDSMLVNAGRYPSRFYDCGFGSARTQVFTFSDTDKIPLETHLNSMVVWWT